MAQYAPRTGTASGTGSRTNEAPRTDALLDHGGWDAMAEAHAWHDDGDGSPAEKKSAYELPHHQVVDGELRVVRAGWLQR